MLEEEGEGETEAERRMVMTAAPTSGAVERRRYQSWAALLISSRPRCLVTLNDTLVGPMVSLRWQHDRPPLLKCKSGFNLKQSRLAEIIFLPPSQVLLSLLSISSPSSLQLLLLPTFPPFLPPYKKNLSLLLVLPPA